MLAMNLEIISNINSPDRSMHQNMVYFETTVGDMILAGRLVDFGLKTNF